MKFKSLLRENNFSLVVSLPSNDIALAKAALSGGADAIKVHLNVWHRASNHSFGNLEDNKEFLHELLVLADNIPVGIVPGGAQRFCTLDEMLYLEKIGVDFFSSYSDHLPVDILKVKKMSKMVAIDSLYSSEIIRGLTTLDIDVLECSIQSGENYGRGLSVQDLSQYASIAEISSLPILIPTQKAIRKHEVEFLSAIGAKGLMIGAIVTGAEPDPRHFEKIVMEYKKSVVNL